MKENENPDIVTDLFSLGSKALIKEKSCALNQLRVMELGLLRAKHHLADKERKILLTTDFKELGLTNEKLRTAYVNSQVSGDLAKIDFQKNKIAAKKDEIEIINDLMKFIELEMKGE